jgi:pimeloyl-ACP methyl ester carboxylesterase
MSGSKYRICMPPDAAWNGNLVIWAHGFQDATEPVHIPEDQLCFAGTCLPDLINSLGFAFATNSYSKTGLAVLQGKDDILDLVKIFTQRQLGQAPDRVYVVGASEGGIITALSVEQYPKVYAGGVAACGPIGDFPFQINYFGDARATFEFFFPLLIPSDPNNIFFPFPGLETVWNDYYNAFVKPVVFDPANRGKLDQWVRVAGLPFDGDDYLNTVAVSVQDVLRYSVVNLVDAKMTLGGFPFDNRMRWYFGSDNDLLLNIFVPRVGADAAAVATMNTQYATTGVLQRPLVTLHTLRDQQVPYFHEVLYFVKTLSSGSFLTRHFNIAIDRFEHCNFTADEALGSFIVLLLYDGVLQGVSGTPSQLTATEQAAFEHHMRAAGVPYRKTAAPLSLELKN